MLGFSLRESEANVVGLLVIGVSLAATALFALSAARDLAVAPFFVYPAGKALRRIETHLMQATIQSIDDLRRAVLLKPSASRALKTPAELAIGTELSAVEKSLADVQVSADNASQVTDAVKRWSALRIELIAAGLAGAGERIRQIMDAPAEDDPARDDLRRRLAFLQGPEHVAERIVILRDLDRLTSQALQKLATEEEERKRVDQRDKTTADIEAEFGHWQQLEMKRLQSGVGQMLAEMRPVQRAIRLEQHLNRYTRLLELWLPVLFGLTPTLMWLWNVAHLGQRFLGWFGAMRYMLPAR